MQDVCIREKQNILYRRTSTVKTVARNDEKGTKHKEKQSETEKKDTDKRVFSVEILYYDRSCLIYNFIRRSTTAISNVVDYGCQGQDSLRGNKTFCIVERRL